MEKISHKNKIQIRETGSYFNIDANGFVINPTSYEKLQTEWKSVINDVVDLYKKIYGEKLQQVYIRGSVAKGEAIGGISDLDTYAYVDMRKEELQENQTIKDARKYIEEKYPFVQGIEMGAYELSKISDDYILLNQSLCVCGNPIEVPKMKTGKEMAIHSPSFYKRFTWFEKFLTKDETDEEIKNGCVWLMKGLLRVGFELTMERSKKYTRDLYRCYETFSEFYPEKEPEMKEVLYLALNPTSDKKKIEEVMNTIGQWLLSEIPNHFEIKN